MWIEIDIFTTKDDAPAGWGRDVFTRQVETAHAMGVDRIQTHGVGCCKDPRWNGYYTWPRFGYDAPLGGSTKSALRADPDVPE